MHTMLTGVVIGAPLLALGGGAIVDAAHRRLPSRSPSLPVVSLQNQMKPLFPDSALGLTRAGSRACSMPSRRPSQRIDEMLAA